MCGKCPVDLLLVGFLVVLISQSYLPCVPHLRFLEESHQCSWVTASERYGGNTHFIAGVSMYLAVMGGRKAQLSSFLQCPAVTWDVSQGGLSALLFQDKPYPLCLPKVGKC